jgi:hypothetical protein
VAAFVGDESLLASLRRVLTVRGLAVTLRAHPPIYPEAGATRRDLAGFAQAALGVETATVHIAGSSRVLQLSVAAGRQS